MTSSRILDELGIEQTHVVGHDFGAAVAWAFALSAPERLDRLVVLSVGHPGVPIDFAQREKSWYMLLFQFEEAEELLRRDDWAFLREWVGTHPEPDRVIADLQRPGALTAGLNWYRANRHPAASSTRRGSSRGSPRRPSASGARATPTSPRRA